MTSLLSLNLKMFELGLQEYILVMFVNSVFFTNIKYVDYFVLNYARFPVLRHDLIGSIGDI